MASPRGICAAQSRGSSVALASGFSSVRRFNTLFRERYRLTPGDIRRRALVSAESSDAIVLSLAYRPPYDWNAILARVELSPSLLPVLAPLQARLGRLLDLDADPRAIAAHLRRAATLAPLVAKRPGLRVAGAADAFELALRAVLGQQVTVRGATTRAGRVARLVAEPAPPDAPAELTHLPVTAARLADARASSLTSVGLTRARADWPDAFPAGDLALRRAMGGLSAAKLRTASEPSRPWRAYAAQHLWARL